VILGLNSSGVSQTTIKLLDSPNYFTLDLSGNLYVYYPLTTNVWKITPGGAHDQSVYASGIEPILCLAIDRSGNLYYSQGKTVYKMTRDGVQSEFATVQVTASALVFDGSDNLYVADER